MNYWSWNGKYIGFSVENYLFSDAGKALGYFCDDELYDFNGRYIGEVKSKDRLIVNKSKKYRSSLSTFVKPCDHAGRSFCDSVGYVMLAGYEDFELMG